MTLEAPRMAAGQAMAAIKPGYSNTIGKTVRPTEQKTVTNTHQHL